jgi:hypothetical protein
MKLSALKVYSTGDRRRRYLADQVVITARQANLKRLFEQVANQSGPVQTALTGQPGAASAGAPEIAVSNKKTLEPARLNLPSGSRFAPLTPDRPLNAQELYDIFKNYSASLEIVSRPFQISRQSKPTAQVAGEISAALNRPNASGLAGFDVSPDHLVAGSWVTPGLSPWDIPARSSGFDLDEGRRRLANQPLWGLIGAEGRQDFQRQGQGVTIVIVDAAPEPENLNPQLVDFYISMPPPGDEVEVDDEINKIDLKEIYSMGRVQPQPLQRPGHRRYPSTNPGQARPDCPGSSRGRPRRHCSRWPTPR